MKSIDITTQVLAMYEEEIMLNMINETKNELKESIPRDLQEALDNCLEKINSADQHHANNIISFQPKDESNFVNFAETELLAAAGTSLADWFSQPMNFGGAGFVLDVRKVIGSDNEVDLYLTPNKSDASKMKNSLISYLGQSINISISNDEVNLLTATLYVDETGCAAEGSGYLAQVDNTNDIKGKISIDIIVDSKSYN